MRCYPRLVRKGLVLAASIAVTLTVSPASATTRSASLRLASKAPLVVQGQRFAPRERVRVSVSGDLQLQRRVIATRSGAFAAEFEAVVTRCDMVRVIAVGARGSHATLKYLPAPACRPD